MSGDVEVNPGPKRNSCRSQNFKMSLELVITLKMSLPLKVLNVKNLQECINLELIICLVLLYFIGPQVNDFEHFMKNFKLNLDEINENKILS